MKKLIFALIIWIAGAPANAQTDLQCGFPACSINVELSPVVVVNNLAKYAEFRVCYANAVGRWETQKEIAWDDFKADQLTVLGAAAATGAACYFGKLQIKSIVSWMETIVKRAVPTYCAIKAAGAGVVAEAGFALHLNKQLNRLCKEHDEAVRACARAIDPNFKECKL